VVGYDDSIRARLAHVDLTTVSQDTGQQAARARSPTASGELVHERIRDHRTRVLSDCLERLPPETAGILLAAVPAMEALAETVKSLPR
jgi:DNA-binding LacI/PurR family transcriptional regulator